MQLRLKKSSLILKGEIIYKLELHFKDSYMRKVLIKCNIAAQSLVKEDT